MNRFNYQVLYEKLQAFPSICDQERPAAAKELISLLRQLCPECPDFREVCENLYDGIHVSDGEGRILYINEAYTRTTGILPEEILGRKVSDIEGEGRLYHGSVTAQVLQKKTRVNSVAEIIKLGKEVLVTGTPVFDSEGKIKLVVTNTRDFPELKRLEKQLLTLTEESNKAKEELAFLRKRQIGDKQLFCSSASMRTVMELIHTIAPTDVTVLITGESGTGKELAANEIYQKSSRCGKPFIKVNCAAIPTQLLESELFGYEEGAFTGAKKSGKAGMFELANTGVIFLDEIGDMPLALQTKLLRVIQQKELLRIGGNQPIKLDIRIIAATNRNLKEQIKEGLFREDLYYRLNVVPIQLQPLRDRKDDIPFLAKQFCDSFSQKYGKTASISPGAIALLQKYAWPGNIRELENLIERMVVTNFSGTISQSDVFSALHPGGLPFHIDEEGNASLKEQVSAFEREVIRHTLEREGSLRKAAKVLGVDHSTLVKKRRHDLFDQEHGSN